jgi:hypothetical protein
VSALIARFQIMRLVLVLSVAAACYRSSPPIAPVANVAEEEVPDRDVSMTRERSRKVIAALSDAQRAKLSETWFLYELWDASGNEGNPARMVARLEREFANPVVVDPATIKAALDAARLANSTLPNGTPDQDWDKTMKVIQPVLDVIPRQGECLAMILANPDEIALAWIVEQYYSKDHYHEYNMQNRMFELVVSTFEKRALAVVEHRLRESGPLGSSHFQGKYWEDATEAAKNILGNKFPSWYRRVKGTTYRTDLEKHRHAQ